MTNLHSHAFQRSFAGRAEYAGGGGDFWSWREAMYRAAGTIEPDTMAPVASYLGMLALQGGFTSLVEFHYLQNAIDGTPYAHRPAMAEAIIEGAQQAGIGLTMLIGIYQTANFGGVRLEPGQRRCDSAWRRTACGRYRRSRWRKPRPAWPRSIRQHRSTSMPPSSAPSWRRAWPAWAPRRLPG
jgi:cytosine/adenosine deaminase-related metal-dependent hydrolase